MKGRDIGLYLVGIGILMLIVYGLYKLMISLSSVDPFVVSAVIVIFMGMILLLVSLIREKREDKIEIKKEDVEP